MPRASYTPTIEERFRVRELARIGMSEDDIASQLRLSLPRLQKIFRLELKEGAAAGREHALKKLHAIAMSGENLPALNFWVKARCGWRDTGPTQSAVGVIRRVIMFKPEPEPPCEQKDSREEKDSRSPENNTEPLTPHS